MGSGTDGQWWMDSGWKQRLASLVTPRPCGSGGHLDITDQELLKGLDAETQPQWREM